MGLITRGRTPTARGREPTIPFSYRRHDDEDRDHSRQHPHGRAAERVEQSVLEQARKRGDADNDLIDLTAVDLPQIDEPFPPAMGRYTHPHTRQWATTVAVHDGYVLVTPECNHSFPGVLKNALDHVYADWNNKAVGLVPYGFDGGVRAVEAVRPVQGALQLADLSATVTLNCAPTSPTPAPRSPPATTRAPPWRRCSTNSCRGATPSLGPATAQPRLLPEAPSHGLVPQSGSDARAPARITRQRRGALRLRAGRQSRHAAAHTRAPFPPSRSTDERSTTAAAARDAADSAADHADAAAAAADEAVKYAGQAVDFANKSTAATEAQKAADAAVKGRSGRPGRGAEDTGRGAGGGRPVHRSRQGRGWSACRPRRPGRCGCPQPPDAAAGLGLGHA